MPVFWNLWLQGSYNSKKSLYFSWWIINRVILSLSVSILCSDHSSVGRRLQRQNLRRNLFQGNFLNFHLADQLMVTDRAWCNHHTNNKQMVHLIVILKHRRYPTTNQYLVVVIVAVVFNLQNPPVSVPPTMHQRPLVYLTVILLFMDTNRYKCSSSLPILYLHDPCICFCLPTRQH